MAETSDRTEPNRSRPVQELAEKGKNEVPDSYIWKDTSRCEPIDLTVPFAEIPIISFSLLISPGAARDQELEKLRLALSSWGCFQLISHGIESLMLDKICKVSQQFFHMPMEEKQKYARSDGSIEGYGNDAVLFENQLLYWVDLLVLNITPENKQKLPYWPQNPQSFRNAFLEYATNITKIEDQILRSIADSVSLPSDCFVKQFGEQQIRYARFNYYPRCPRPELVNGLKPHSDGSGLTLLLQDKEVDGLQLQKDNQWFRVPIVPQALLVNLGDQMEIMSNGVFKSPVHRAVTNTERERMSLAMFCIPDPENEVGPAEELIDEKRPRLYKKTKNYTSLFFHHYQQGKRPIDAVRV